MTCYLFPDYSTVTEESILPTAMFAVRIDQTGNVAETQAALSWSACKTWMGNEPAIVVLPSKLASFHEVELPWLGEHKTRALLPFALEDHVAMPIEKLHFAFDRRHTVGQRYLVVVLAKQILNDWISSVKTHQINCHTITLDWFALMSQEVAILPDYVLVNQTNYRGAITPDLYPLYTQIQTRNTTADLQSGINTAIIEGHHQSWVAQRLLNHAWINLCQGDCQLAQQRPSLWFNYRMVALLLMMVFINPLLFNSIKGYSLDRKLATLDLKIKTAYFVFFPNSHQVISPQFRVQQWLKAQTTAANTVLWRILLKFTQSIDPKRVQVTKLEFKGSQWTVALEALDMVVIEQLEKKLSKESIHVKQLMTTIQHDRVITTMELTL